MISIIVPIYNAQSYLAECLESIRNQTYTDFEAILINDGSKDGSLDICQRYGQGDSRFRIIDNPNHGVSYSRNIGLDESKGEYIAFLDSDDKYDNDFLEVLLGRLYVNSADISVCDFYNENGRENPGWKTGTIRDDEIFVTYLHGYFCNRIMNKLYRRTVIQGIEFPEERPVLEDADWTSSVLLKCRTVSVVSEGKYYYRIVDNSLSRRKMSLREEVGSFRNAINQYIRIAENVPNHESVFLVNHIVRRLAWMLLSNSDLTLFDTYHYMRILACNSIFEGITDLPFRIIREEERPEKAQEKYYKHVMKDANVPIADKIKYSYRRYHKNKR